LLLQLFGIIFSVSGSGNHDPDLTALGRAAVIVQGKIISICQHIGKTGFSTQPAVSIADIDFH